MARNVACTGRVAVVPPCAAHIVRLFVEGEVVVSEQALELDCHTKTRNTPSDDNHFFLMRHGEEHDSS